MIEKCCLAVDGMEPCSAITVGEALSLPPGNARECSVEWHTVRHLVGNGLRAVPPSPRNLHGTLNGIPSGQIASHSTGHSGPVGYGSYADGTAHRPFPTVKTIYMPLNQTLRYATWRAAASRPYSELGGDPVRQTILYPCGCEIRFRSDWREYKLSPGHRTA